MAFKGFKNVKKFQLGGEMAPAEDPNAAPVEGGAEAPAQGGEDPMMMIAQAAAQALQTQDCQVALQVCQAFIELVQQAQGGGAPAELGAPVYRKGGILVRRVRK